MRQALLALLPRPSPRHPLDLALDATSLADKLGVDSASHESPVPKIEDVHPSKLHETSIYSGAMRTVSPLNNIDVITETREDSRRDRVRRVVCFLTLQKVESEDGTTIVFDRTGTGPPLVLVHGTGGSSKRWVTTLPRFQQNFTVYAVDRRGRGDSGDSENYAIEREFEDIAAVVDSIRQPVSLLGHSFGGLCSLEASLLTNNIRKLVLYEAPIPVPDVRIYDEALIESLQAMVDRGDMEGVLTTFLREVVRMPQHELDLLRSQPAWPARVAAAHTIPRELRAHQHYKFEPARFKHMGTQTLLLLGSESPRFLRAAVEVLKEVLPNSHLALLPGQQHIADQTAPELFLGAVLNFLV